ncbi:MAG: DUF1553 domain-containing protein [Acidobacteria bacterium]|nr:DUF1553 domain-containing protein [Acidobacteriota bacterium]
MNRILFFLCCVAARAGAASLAVYPPAIVLEAGAAQTILVVATDEAGVTTDVTAQATCISPRFAACQPGLLQGLVPGETTVTFAHGDLRAAVRVTVRTSAPRAPSFINDVVPVFTRADCASSNCHGSVRGQMGFKLSLFGSDPDLDHRAITELNGGRRVDRTQPANSLLLRKPTMQVAHGGGLRFSLNSPEHRTVLAWLERGASKDQTPPPGLTSLDVYPPGFRLTGLGSRVRVVAVGRYADGSSRDLTPRVRFSSNVPAIAAVDASGEITAETPGETAIMVRTLGRAAAVPVLVVRDRPMTGYPAIPEANDIDRHVFAKLRAMNIVPSQLASDDEFLRRVYLDVTGITPTVGEIRRFRQSPDRARLIDELLERPERASIWAMRLADMFRAGYNEAGQKGGNAFGRWFRDNVRRNTPYDVMVRQLLASQGRHDFEGPSNFYFVSREIDPEESAVNVSQVLLGIQIECARCHNHPFERWSQDDFYGFSAFFARVERKDMYLNNHNATFLKNSGEVIHPRTKKAVPPKYLDGPVEPEAPGTDVREKLAVWLTSPQNPFFARAAVNRVWRFFLGRGIVEAADDFRVTNPPVNEPLLAALAEDFIATGYDLKKLERRILNSRVYQLSSQTNPTNQADQTNYSHFYVRRLMAEQVIDTMAQVTGVVERFTSQPPGRRAMEIPVLPFTKPHYMMKTFGRSDLREVICERDAKPSVAQVMHLIGGDTLQRQITGAGGTLDKLLADAGVTNEAIVQQLYLAALTREPSPEETRAVLTGMTPETRRRGFEDLLWALFNSKEFLFHH